MAVIRRFNPITPARRYYDVLLWDELTKKKPQKNLTQSLKRTGGRNNGGRITVRHHGGGHKRRYRIVDFRRDKFNVPATVSAIEYDPNRSAWIALLHYVDGEKRYILAPDGLKVGSKVVSGDKAEIEQGNCLPLRRIPVGTVIHNIELKKGRGGQMVRSAGNGAQLLAKEGEYVQVRLPSGEVRKIFSECMATVGQIGNASHENVSIGKAGRKRWLGIRPTVRGTAMNPVDHPHGGGQGKSKGGNHPSSPWGWHTKGLKTRKNKRTDKYIIMRRKNKNKMV